mmetsp:Transcript_33132/g.93790  ORF Transcript_33132/g.93790 Transcript_33132/m.93790 type:complete len:209 (+) Transcript_33132:1218-1844(+)
MRAAAAGGLAVEPSTEDIVVCVPEGSGAPDHSRRGAFLRLPLCPDGQLLSGLQLHPPPSAKNVFEVCARHAYPVVPRAPHCFRLLLVLGWENLAFVAGQKLHAERNADDHRLQPPPQQGVQREAVVVVPPEWPFGDAHQAPGCHQHNPQPDRDADEQRVLKKAHPREGHHRQLEHRPVELLQLHRARACVVPATECEDPSIRLDSESP